MSADRIAERANVILARSRGLPRIDALSEADRSAWARVAAESELAAEAASANRRAEPARRRTAHAAAVADLSAKAGVTPAIAEEAIKRRRRADRLEAIERAERALTGGTAPRERRGPSSDRVDRYARKALELREPDGTWPPQEAVAEALSVTDRSIRDVGWQRILARAAELGGPTGSSGGSSG